ncbi:hypothetical protein [Cryobacterium sp. TMT4-31]|uniref:hypothetical protein n=1 Tax=Cryobacterium sp. TMT4-31 TaxID=1259259 RepID=UPI00106D5D6C|nr:hypothetical protein [Cryobacterium sp. TMT4-31]TFC90049.1 hypothetical protein E3T19_07155 [Cryobacterium sp. TMT4-31]
MSDLDPSVDLDSQPQTVRRGRRGVTPAVLALPLLAVAGILVVAWTVGVDDTCGGPVPGCGSLRNSGDIPVTVRAVIDCTTEATGVWHPVDDKGARVQLHDRPCPESS